MIRFHAQVVQEGFLRMSEIKVVLAENQDDPMLVLRESLKKGGLRVAVCTSGFDALDEIINEGGDVLVMSEHLPDISGLQLSCLIKATNVTSGLPIVLVTATDKDDNFWKRASLADSVLQRKHVEFNEDESVELIKRLAVMTDGAVTKEKLEDQPVLTGQFTGTDLIKSYGELLNGLLAERLIHHFTHRLLSTLPDRGELTNQFFELMTRLFRPDLTGIVVSSPLGPWGVFHCAKPLNEDIVQALVGKANVELGLTVPVASTIYGEATKDGAKLKKAKLLPVSSADGTTKLGSLIVGWTEDTDVDSVLKTALEHLRDQMSPILQLMLAEDRYSLLHDQAQYWSTVDPVTGLYNMEFFMGFLQQQLLFSQRQKLPVGLLLLDIDGFVSINAQYGSEVGNLLLKTLTSKLSKSIRSSDLVARYGGDQFAIVLPNTDIGGCKLVAEKLKSEAEMLNPSAEEAGKAPRVTISIGCAQFDYKDPTPEAVLKGAKDALNRAKEKGRNCISD
jgi:diguanylate cyclase (GGDEF)-like protein